MTDWLIFSSQPWRSGCVTQLIKLQRIVWFTNHVTGQIVFEEDLGKWRWMTKKDRNNIRQEKFLAAREARKVILILICPRSHEVTLCGWQGYTDSDLPQTSWGDPVWLTRLNWFWSAPVSTRWPCVADKVILILICSSHYEVTLFGLTRLYWFWPAPVIMRWPWVVDKIILILTCQDIMRWPWVVDKVIMIQICSSHYEVTLFSWQGCTDSDLPLTSEGDLVWLTRC